MSECEMAAVTIKKAKEAYGKLTGKPLCDILVN